MMQAAVQAPALSTRAPEIVNSGGTLTVSIPILNSGNATASRLTIAKIVLGTSAASQPMLPLVLGDVTPDNTVALSPAFSVGGLVVGNRYLLVIRGTYRMGTIAYGLTLNRYITIPAATAPPVPSLSAHVAVAVDQIVGRWSYTISNDESPNSPRFINAISLDVAAAFIVTGTPPGWAADTDNQSYVLWYATDTAVPYPSHIAPGSARSGFHIQDQSGQRWSESMAYSITSWNHQTDRADLTATGTTLTPSRL